MAKAREKEIAKEKAKVAREKVAREKVAKVKAVRAKEKAAARAVSDRHPQREPVTSRPLPRPGPMPRKARPRAGAGKANGFQAPV